MLNEKNSHLTLIGIDFEMNEITKARDDESRQTLDKGRTCPGFLRRSRSSQ
jgi:hypothetical protein